MYLTAYRLAVRAGHRFPLPTAKLAQSVAGRRSATKRWITWARQHRTAAPLLWIHGASVGELQTAEPVIARLRALRPSLQVITTFSSPSAIPFVSMLAADRTDFVPLDEPTAVGEVLDALRPSALVFSHGDLWPELVEQAGCRAVWVAVMAGMVHPRSLRLARPVRHIFRRVTQSIAWLGAVSQQDAERWVGLGVPPATVEVTGTPRHDQVLERIPRMSHLVSLGDWCRDAQVLIAGSAEPSDNATLLDAAANVLPRHDGARLLVVPHRPTERSMRAVLREVHARHLFAERWSPGDQSPTAPIVVVEGVGHLFDLYLCASVAYVGGGFRHRRLHSVIEPAAFALPVVVGPRWEGFSDAAALLDAGGAIALPPRGAAHALATHWRDWARDAHAGARAGVAARGTLQPGAATATARALSTFL